MGTNYYFKPSVEDSELSDIQSIHIGKYSAGWSFTFHGYSIKSEFNFPEGSVAVDVSSKLGSEDGILYRQKKVSFNINSKKSWIDFIRNHKGTVVNEYGTEFTVDEFEKIVEEVGPTVIDKQTGFPLRNNADVSFAARKDSEGYSFSYNDFF